jgi:hypothetical protein
MWRCNTILSYHESTVHAAVGSNPGNKNAFFTFLNNVRPFAEQLQGGLLSGGHQQIG